MPPRGSGQFGPDVLVGSPEYMKKMREKNPNSFKLAQAKYRLKQKQLILAQKLAVADDIPFEQAYAEVVGKIDAVVAVRAEMVVEGRIDHHAGKPPIDVEDSFPVQECAREAEERGVPYAVVKAEYLAAANWNKPVQVSDEWSEMEKVVELLKTEDGEESD